MISSGQNQFIPTPTICSNLDNPKASICGLNLLIEIADFFWRTPVAESFEKKSKSILRFFKYSLRLQVA